MIANKLRLAYPIVLVLGGLALSFIAPFSTTTINPELVFLIFLPPLLYEAAWQVSWKEFWKWRGLIIGFAFPIVILTSCVIAVVSSAGLPSGWHYLTAGCRFRNDDHATGQRAKIAGQHCRR